MKIEGEYESDSSDEHPKATPISPGLDPIMEESDEEMMTSSEPYIRRRKERSKKKKKTAKGGAAVPMMPVFVMNPYMNVEPGQMPTFRSGKKGQVPYQLAFAPMQVEPTGKRRPKKKQAQNSKGHTVSFNAKVGVSPDPSTSSLPQSGKMLTFSSLRVKKEKKGELEVVPVSGSYTGHASMNISTITKNSAVVKKGIMKKSSSDSSTT